MVTLKKIRDDITKKQTEMLKNVNSMKTFLDIVIFRKYQAAQMKRWMSENRSEGERWKPISQSYKESKQKTYKDYPGSGRKLMIATGSLLEAVITKPIKVATNKSLMIATNGSLVNPKTSKPVSEYSEKVATDRPYMEFSDKTIKDLRDAVTEYILLGAK